MDRSTTRGLIAGAIVIAAGIAAGAAYLALRSPADSTAALKGPYQPKHHWRSVRSRHWQIISSEYEEPSVTDAREGTRGNCPEGMVHVTGEMKLEPQDNPYEEGRIETMQLRLCTEWIQREYPERCQQFDKAAWLEVSKTLETKPMDYCIDRYEYPNVKGQYPIIYVSWYEALELCQLQGKRLCDEDEWTFACEGEDAQPYPYGDGYTRDPSKCITDSQWLAYNEKSMVPRDGDMAGHEMDRLWNGFASGAQTECRSPKGVYDMTGNVDEWTRSVRPGERPSILKGGYWGPVRTRCRPSTRSHDQNHTFYQQGFRCCADAGTQIGRDVSKQPATAPLPEALE